MELQVHMPSNWDDHAGWDDYYREQRLAKQYLDRLDISFQLMGSMQYAKGFDPTTSTKIWVAGCGSSILPHILHKIGFDVWATDVSKEAIQIQQELHELALSEYLDEAVVTEIETLKKREGKLNTMIHDFRDAFSENDFDVILNIRAFQGLSQVSMQATAHTHFQSLKEGRLALIVTQNVQGALRTVIEETLVAAGFLVPFHEVDKWYRQQLDATGIPYSFILGNPIPNRHYGGDDVDSQRQKDTQILRSFSEAYHERKLKERDELQARIDNDKTIKIAQVVYNTG